MMNKLVGFFVLGLMLIQGQVWAASFDCSATISEIEKKICIDSDLSDLDSELSRAFKVSKASVRLQSNWLKQVRDKCRDTDCLKKIYQERISLLEKYRQPMGLSELDYSLCLIYGNDICDGEGVFIKEMEKSVREIEGVKQDGFLMDRFLSWSTEVAKGCKIAECVYDHYFGSLEKNGFNFSVLKDSTKRGILYLYGSQRECKDTYYYYQNYSSWGMVSQNNFLKDAVTFGDTWFGWSNTVDGRHLFVWNNAGQKSDDVRAGIIGTYLLIYRAEDIPTDVIKWWKSDEKNAEPVLVEGDFYEKIELSSIMDLQISSNKIDKRLDKVYFYKFNPLKIKGADYVLWAGLVENKKERLPYYVITDVMLARIDYKTKAMSVVCYVVL